MQVDFKMTTGVQVWHKMELLYGQRKGAIKPVGTPQNTNFCTSVPSYYYYCGQIFIDFLVGKWKEVPMHQTMWQMDIVCES